MELKDDYTKKYNGEELPQYIKTKMFNNDQTEVNRRYYLSKHTGIKFLAIDDSVETIEITSPKDGDIAFAPIGGGKYIFSNSPETITEDYVADGNGKRYWIMNNYGLTAGNYSMTMYHHTNQLSEPVKIDAKFYAEEDSTIVVNKFGFGKPADEWASLNIYADYINNDINAPNNYTNHKRTYRHTEMKTPYQFKIDEGKSYWLSDIYNVLYHEIDDGSMPIDYPVIGGYATYDNGDIVIDENGNKVINQTPIFGMMDFDVVSGFVDVDILAYRDRDKIDDNSRIDSPYIFENHHKGVADSLPGVKAELFFKIDDNMEFDEYCTGYLKARTFAEKNIYGNDNQYNWVSHINPQSDMYTDKNGVENDILPLKYSDRAKLQYYADNVPDNEKNDIWTFDTIHTQIRTPKLSAIPNPRDNKIRILNEIYDDSGIPSGFKPNDYLKNGYYYDNNDNAENTTKYTNNTFEVNDQFNDYKLLAASLGNYGVVEKYIVNVTNNSNETRYLNYKITVDSNIVIERQGKYVLHNSGAKNKDNVLKKTDDTGVEYFLIELPPNKTTTVEFSITLPTADSGGVKNNLVITKTRRGIDADGNTIYQEGV